MYPLRPASLLSTALSTTAIFTFILALMYIGSAYTGWRRGVLSSGRWVLGIVLGFLAAPVISPYMEKLVFYVIGLFAGETPAALESLMSAAVRILVFALSVKLIQAIVNMVTDIDLPKAASAIDRALGLVFGIAKVYVFIQIVDFLLKRNNIPAVQNARAALMGIPIYSITVTGYNFAEQLFSFIL